MAGSIWGAVDPARVERGALAAVRCAERARHRSRAANRAARCRSVPGRRSRSPTSRSSTPKPGRSYRMRPCCFTATSVAAVGGAEVSVPSDARRIDGTGKTLLPGLWNMHMHLFADFGPRLLAEGVTTIRDPGNNPEYIAKTKAQFESGELRRPARDHRRVDGRHRQVYRSDRNDHGDRRTSDRASARVEKDSAPCRSRSTARWIRSSYPSSSKRRTRKECALAVTSRPGCSRKMRYRKASTKSSTSTSSFLNFMPDTDDRTQTPIRLTATAERAGTIDLQSQQVEGLHRAAKRPRESSAIQPSESSTPIR